MSYKNTSTSRLLNLFRGLRGRLFAANYYAFDSEEDDQERANWESRLDEMKAELDTREHVPRKHENKRKEKKKLLYKRK